MSGKPLLIELAGQEFTVNWHARDLNDMRKVGEIKADQLQILISDDQAEHRQRQTLVHEILHGLIGLGDAGCKHEEHIVEVLSVLLLDTLRRNPHLVSYLQA